MSNSELTTQGNIHQVTFTLVAGTMALQLPKFYPSSRVLGLSLVNVNATPVGASKVPNLNITFPDAVGAGNASQNNATVDVFSSTNDVSTYTLSWVNSGGVWAN